MTRGTTWNVEYAGGFYLDAIAHSGPLRALLQPVSLLAPLLEDTGAGPLTELLRSFHHDINREWELARNLMDPLSLTEPPLRMLGFDL